MALIGRLHPLLVHFPIGLVLIAAVAEVVAMATGLRDWRAATVANVRVGALFAIGAAMAGWRLASGIEATSSLEWPGWLLEATGAYHCTIHPVMVGTIQGQ